MRKTVIAFVAALTAMGIAPAAAAEASVAVSYADLNLSAPAGASVLKQRIAAAADRVCHKPHIRDLKAMVAWNACRTAVRADAVERLSAREPAKSLALATLF